jgi:hypothetical protein
MAHGIDGGEVERMAGHPARSCKGFALWTIDANVAMRHVAQLRDLQTSTRLFRQLPRCEHRVHSC